MLLREILSPNLFAIPDGRIIELVTTAGDTLEVLRLGETGTRVKLFDVTSFPPVTRNIRKDRILSEKPTSRSAMPDTYASRYTVQAASRPDLLHQGRFRGAAGGLRGAVLVHYPRSPARHLELERERLGTYIAGCSLGCVLDFG